MQKLFIGIIVTSTIAVVFAVVVIIAVTLGIVLSKDSSSETSNGNNTPDVPYDPSLISNNPYMSNEMDTLEVVSSTKFSGIKPRILTMKYDKYPYFGNEYNFTEDERIKIIEENTDFWINMKTMIESNTYGRMDPQLGGEKQFGATGVDWDLPRNTIKYGIYSKVRGLRLTSYALPGEIITITIPEGLNIGESNLQVCIGKCQLEWQRQNSTVSFWFNDKMPLDTFEMPLKETEMPANRQFKFVTPFGGGVYIFTNDRVQNWDSFYLTISNVARAPIINYNITTNEEWSKIKMTGNVGEVRVPGVRLAMSAKYMRDVVDAEFVGRYWHEAISVGNIFTNTDSTIPITIMFDQRIDAGEALAYVGGWFCQCPLYWAQNGVTKDVMYNQLNWGTLHEMNHHMEGTLTSYNNRGRWGMDIHETNNNVMNAMFHIEYTNVAGNRENGIGDWGFITDGYWTMKDVYLGNVKSYIQLRSYVAPAFSFGTQAVKQVIKNYYNLFYEEDYGTKFNKDRNDTGIYCLLTARAIERDTRYFCKIFGYEIDSAIASYIKGLNYKTWFPFYNLYSNSYDGNKYGRVYHVPYQIKTRLNFNEKTAMDNTTTKVKFEILDGFKKGTIEEISSGVYDYTANFKPNETDTFKVKMTFNVNGESGSIVFGGEFVTTNKMKKVDVYTLESKPSNIQKAEEMIKDKEPNSMRTSSSAGIAAYNDKVGEVDKSTVNIMRGNLVVPDSGYYTLFVKCDDYGKLEVNMSGELEKIGERGSYLGSYDKTNANTFKTVVLKKEETYEYIITNVNTGGQGSFDIGYCYHGDRESDVDMDKCTPANIPTNWVFCDGLTKSDVETPYVFPEIKYPRKIYNLNYKMYTVKDCNSTVCGVECLELPIKHDDSNVCENIFDRDTNTIYHSKYSGNGTPFPTTYKFNYTEIAKFDSIEMKFRRSEDSFGLFNMYCGNEKEEYVNILSVTENKTQQQKTFTFDKIYECKYIKMDVQNNAAGNKYVVLQDFNMFLSQSYKNLAKPTAKTFNVIGFKTKSALGYFENVLLENEKAGEGQIEFKMKGSKLGVFGEYRGGMGSWTLLVDGKAPTMDQELQSNSNIQRTLYQVFTFDEGTHNMILKVKEGFVNIDVVGFE